MQLSVNQQWWEKKSSRWKQTLTLKGKDTEEEESSSSLTSSSFSFTQSLSTWPLTLLHWKCGQTGNKCKAETQFCDVTSCSCAVSLNFGVWYWSDSRCSGEVLRVRYTRPLTSVTLWTLCFTPLEHQHDFRGFTEGSTAWYIPSPSHTLILYLCHGQTIHTHTHARTRKRKFRYKHDKNSILYQYYTGKHATSKLH